MIARRRSSRRFVAAIGVGMVDLHQGLVGALDLVRLGAGLEAQRLEGAAIVLVQLDRALGSRAAGVGARITGPDVKRVGETLRLEVRVALGHARAIVGARLGAKAPARPAVGLGGRVEMLLALGFGHVGEEVEGRVVVADMLQAEMVILALRSGDPWAPCRYRAGRSLPRRNRGPALCGSGRACAAGCGCGRRAWNRYSSVLVTVVEPSRPTEGYPYACSRCDCRKTFGEIRPDPP